MRAFLWMRILAVGLLLLPGLGEAAVVKTETLQSAAGATGDGTVLTLGGRYSSLALTVTISATATVTFEGSEDGSTYASITCVSTANTSGTLVTTATATGSYQCGVSGLAAFRARISSFGSGTVTVTGTASDLALGRKGGSSGGAPADATYLTTTANGTLSDEVVIGVVDDTTIVGNGSTMQAKTLPSCSNATTSKLLYNNTTNEFSCGTDQDSGAGSGMTHPQTMARASIGF